MCGCCDHRQCGRCVHVTGVSRSVGYGRQNTGSSPVRMANDKGAGNAIHRRETIRFAHESRYYCQIEGDRLTITNGENYDCREEVRLTMDDQLALLQLIADRFGVSVEGL